MNQFFENTYNEKFKRIFNNELRMCRDLIQFPFQFNIVLRYSDSHLIHSFIHLFNPLLFMLHFNTSFVFCMWLCVNLIFIYKIMVQSNYMYIKSKIFHFYRCFNFSVRWSALITEVFLLWSGFVINSAIFGKE